jgi:hypothetical protein
MQDQSQDKSNPTINKSISFLVKKKAELKENKYRREFDSLCLEIQENLINTGVVKRKIDESTRTMVYWPTLRSDGSTDWAVFPRVSGMEQDVSNVPRSAEPLAFSKILVAASAIAANIPDGDTFSTNKIKARAYKELWKRSMEVPEMNAQMTVQTSTQNIFTYGWAAWRIYPKQDVIDKTIDGVKTKKIIFDDIYREPLDPRRTWLGLSYKPTHNVNRPEVLYEIDVTKEEYEKLKKRMGKRSKDSASVSIEAMNEDSEKSTTHVTLCFYENPADNRYIIASDNICFYDGEMPNDEVYGSVVVGHCFISNQKNPYTVGLYEMIRGNAAIYNYINSVNAEQVVAEIEPLLFASGITGQGDLSYKRGANRINQLPNGAKLDKILTTGNVTLGINYADAQKRDIEENTGVNNIVSGSSSETTLGATVILKEAALNRLIIPRNSLKQMLENDACIFFSWLEQDQVNPREFVFANEDQVKAFVSANPSFTHTEGESETPDTDEFDEYGIPSADNPIRVYSSQNIPVSFDYSNPSNDNQQMQEFGSPQISISKSTMLSSIYATESPDQMGYDKVLLKIDPNSMLLPSAEIQKQTAMQLFPLIQSSLQLIFGLAKADPIQAVSQLTSLKTFLEVQKENIFDYIPKQQYDMIMQGGMVKPFVMGPDGQPIQGGPQGGAPAPGGSVMPDGTSPTQAPAPQERALNQSPMNAAVQASIGRAAS